MLAIVMPVFNESDGIENFINEINLIFQNIEFGIFIIDDNSSDKTPSLLEELKSKNQINDWKRNLKNLGHGPSTLNALVEGINSKADYIIAVDGDGQFQARDMLKIYNELLRGFVVVVSAVLHAQHVDIERGPGGVSGCFGNGIKPMAGCPERDTRFARGHVRLEQVDETLGWCAATGAHHHEVRVTQPFDVREIRITFPGRGHYGADLIAAA